MKNREIAEFWIALNRSEITQLKGAKFAFAIAKNKIKVRPIVEALEEVRSKAFDETNKFDKDRILLCIEYSDKDKDGKPKMFSDPVRGSQYEIVSRRKEFDKEIEALKNKHKDSIESKERLDAEFKELLEKEEEIDLHKVALDDVPDSISVAAMTRIMPMISEK